MPSNASYFEQPPIGGASHGGYGQHEGAMHGHSHAYADMGLTFIPAEGPEGYAHRDAPITQITDDPLFSAATGEHIVSFSPGVFHREPQGPLLPVQREEDAGKKTLVLDLDETLVHSSYVPVPDYAFTVAVDVEGRTYEIFVSVRPGVQEFLKRISRSYELVVFTASLPKYAQPVIDYIDPDGYCSAQLFRDSCTFAYNTYVKDLSKLGRDLRKVVIVDNSSKAFCLQPFNGIRIRAWYDDVMDKELDELVPILEHLAPMEDIPAVMKEVLRNLGPEAKPDIEGALESVASQQHRGESGDLSPVYSQPSLGFVQRRNNAW